MISRIYKPVTVKLWASLVEVKDHGRIRGYEISLGHVEGVGASPAAAKEALERKLTKLADEDAQPVIRIDAAGDAWVAYRTPWGAWFYGRFRRDDRPNATPGAVIACGSSSTGDQSRATTLAAMDAHLASLAAQEGK